MSDRECDRAAQAAVKELPDPVPAPKPELEVELIDLPREPVSKPVAAETEPESQPAGTKVEKARRLKSTAEMAAEL